MNTTSDESSGDEYDKNLGIALQHQQMTRQTVNAVNMFAIYYCDTFVNKDERREPEVTGYECVTTTMNRPKACYKMFMLRRSVFDNLHEALTRNYGLQSSTGMSYIECLTMFLWAVGGPQPIRQVENRFERSTEIINRKFNHVLNYLNRLAVDNIKLTVHSRLQEAHFSPHFHGAIGAIDGTHIPVVVLSSVMIAHFGRYRETTQNVLVVCDFDMRFTFVVAEWPGSVHDTRVFNEALVKYANKFPFPPEGKKNVRLQHYL
jgi:hypothetical protein